MRDLTAEQHGKLDAIVEVCRATGRATFLLRSHWRGEPGQLARRGLVTWRRPTAADGFDPRRFRMVEPTEAGIAAAIRSLPPEETHDAE